MAEPILANKKAKSVIHNRYAFMVDGCLEGISHEVCWLAGTQGLDKHIAFGAMLHFYRLWPLRRVLKWYA